MSRYRLYPTQQQEEHMLTHCSHARFVWNLALEQAKMWRRGRGWPSHLEQCRQLAEARAEFAWLAAGSSTVQQQALRDFDQAITQWKTRKRRFPRWRKRGGREGFRIVGSQGSRHVTLNRRWSTVLIPKVGWVKFRRTRAVPNTKSYRVTRDPSGRWHIAFNATPAPLPDPANGEVVGLDRGVAVSAMLSTGAALNVPRPSASERRCVRRLQRSTNRKRARGHTGSTRLSATQRRINKLYAREGDRRRDWVEKTSTDLARRFSVVRVEDLNVSFMTKSAKGTADAPGRNVRAKAKLTLSIRESAWAPLVRRLEDKAPGRVEKVSPAYTSQRCSRCGHVDRKSRESQARFRCTSCGFAANADVNAAINIAAGCAVTARGAVAVGQAVNREPQRSTAPSV